MRVLIGYASRFGSTRGIAMRIADVVRSHGNAVDVRSVEEIWAAVVLGWAWLSCVSLALNNRHAA